MKGKGSACWPRPGNDSLNGKPVREYLGRSLNLIKASPHCSVPAGGAAGDDAWLRGSPAAGVRVSVTERRRRKGLLLRRSPRVKLVKRYKAELKAGEALNHSMNHSHTRNNNFKAHLC